jgi:hypothetical protein
MPTDVQRAIDELQNALEHRPHTSGTTGVIEVATVLQNCVFRWAPARSAHAVAAAKVNFFPATAKADPERHMRGIAGALLADYREGRIGAFEEMVRGDMFDDLLDAADDLAKHRHLLGGAVTAGAALEAHLRALALKCGVSLLKNGRDGNPDPKQPKELSDLNNDVAKSGKAHSDLEALQVKVWAKIRNDGAHAKPAFKAYTKADIVKYVAGIRAFVKRHPA